MTPKYTNHHKQDNRSGTTEHNQYNMPWLKELAQPTGNETNADMATNVLIDTGDIDADVDSDDIYSGVSIYPEDILHAPSKSTIQKRKKEKMREKQEKQEKREKNVNRSGNDTNVVQRNKRKRKHNNAIEKEHSSSSSSRSRNSSRFIDSSYNSISRISKHYRITNQAEFEKWKQLLELDTDTDIPIPPVPEMQARHPVENVDEDMYW